MNPKPQKDIKRLPGEYRMDIGRCIILTFVTLGLYYVYWKSRQFKAVNELLKRDEYRFLPWLFFSFITLGVYHLYTEYRLGADLAAYLKEQGIETGELMSAVLAFFYIVVFSDAVYQSELNRLCL